MRTIGRFLVLVFAITWGLWAVVLRVATEHPGQRQAPPLLALGGPVFLIGVFAPGLVAVGLTALDEGPRSAGALLSRIGRWRVGVRYYAFALLDGVVAEGRGRAPAP